MAYRHEYKCQIDLFSAEEMRWRLLNTTKRDIHGGLEGSYRVRSLYFDTPEDRALREKINGVPLREKFRIRYYNDDLGNIRLEKKSRFYSLGEKQSVSLNIQEVRQLLQGEDEWLLDRKELLLQELYMERRQRRLQPKVMIEYCREAFICETGNTRITLDRNIRVGTPGENFLQEDALTVPLYHSEVILEVKWDAFLPDVIREITILPRGHAMAFSKYAAGRIYG